MLTQTRPVRSGWILNILKKDMKDMLMDCFGHEERRGFKNDCTIYLRITFFDVKLGVRYLKQPGTWYVLCVGKAVF